MVRTIANDIIFDVLMYQQRELRDKILKFVGGEIWEVLRFRLSDNSKLIQLVDSTTTGYRL